MNAVGGNYSALLELVNSDKIIEIAVVESFQTSLRTTTYDPVKYESDAEVLYSGAIEIGEIDPDISLDEYINQEHLEFSTKKVFVGHEGSTVYKTNENPFVGKALSGDIEVYLNQDLLNYGKDGLRELTKKLAHELYGHALFRIQGKPSSHGKSIKSNDPNIEGANWELEQQIENRENEAEQNFNTH